MSNIGIIINREYMSRVKKKSFLILTFVTPIFMVALMFVPAWIMTLKDDTAKTIVIVDKSNQLRTVFEDTDIYTFVFSDDNIDNVRERELQAKKKDKSLTAVLYVGENIIDNPNDFILYSDKQINVELKDYLTSKLNNFIRESRIKALDIPDFESVMKDTKVNANITTVKWDGDGKEKRASAEMALIIGMIGAFMIYIFIMSYGSQVMQGVMQEKTSRIVEVIISSVKPFELMMGKVIGIALVGLTQFTIWIVATMILAGVASTFFGVDLGSTTNMPETTMQLSNDLASTDNDATAIINDIMQDLSSFNFVKVLLLFLFYFLGGYLLYASFFAAIGSAVDNETDTQQFMMPITLPIIISIFIGMYAAQNPDSALAFWGSIIPLTSPIVMMGRIAYDVPTWELVLSMFLLIISFIGTIWLAGKIYRTGILMYGKKVTWKELWKWLRVS